jgi:hypothetical protein
MLFYPVPDCETNMDVMKITITTAEQMAGVVYVLGVLIVSGCGWLAIEMVCRV